MTHPTTAILLAAGCSRRLGALTETRPKCLLEVGGRSLIEHQLDAMRAAGVERFVIVTGYLADKVRATCGHQDVEYVQNDDYATTNSLYSLGLALARGAGGFVLTNADVLFDPELLIRLLRAPGPDALLFEPGEALGDEEMKVRVSPQGTVEAMAKSLPAGGYHGENLGVLKFSADAHARLTPIVDALLAENQANAWAPKAFDRLSQEHPIQAISSRGLPWIEIDFPEDLARAREVVWPRIRARQAEPRQNATS